MKDLARRSFRRILIIKPSSPGDIIHALPVLHGLRQRYLQAHLAWLVATPFANLIEADPALDEVIPFDRRRFGRMAGSPSVALEFLAFVKELRARRFDLVIDLQGLFRSGFLARGCGAPARIGFADARELAWVFYNHRIKRGASDRHAADRNYDIANILGFADTEMDFSIAVTADDRHHAAGLLKEAGLEGKSRHAVLVPGTRWETKCWPPDRYGQLAALIRRRYGLSSVLVGGPTDVAIGDIAANASDSAAVNLCGRTTLRQLAALIERSSIVVTADSTPMHLAAALDRPLVALFGPTNPQRTGPHGRGLDVMRLDLECSPCYLRRLRQCPHDHRCMDRLTVEEVAAAIEPRLE